MQALLEIDARQSICSKIIVAYSVFNQSLVYYIDRCSDESGTLFRQKRFCVSDYYVKLLSIMLR